MESVREVFLCLGEDVGCANQFDSFESGNGDVYASARGGEGGGFGHTTY